MGNVNSKTTKKKKLSTTRPNQRHVNVNTQKKTSLFQGMAQLAFQPKNTTVVFTSPEIENDDSSDLDFMDILEQRGRQLQWEKLQRIKDRLIDAPIDICDSKDRKLHYEAILFRASRLKTLKRKALLFNDTFLLAKPLKGDKLQVKQVLDIRKMVIRREGGNLKHSFTIQTPERKYILGAESEEDKDEWLNALRKVIVNLQTTDEKTANPLDNAMSHLKGILKAGADPALHDAVTEVLTLLNKVKTSTEDRNRKSKLRKKIDKDIEEQHEEVGEWLRGFFMPADNQRIKRHGQKSARASTITRNFIAALTHTSISPVKRVLDITEQRNTIEKKALQGQITPNEVEKFLWESIQENIKTKAPLEQIRYHLLGFTTRAIVRERNINSWERFDIFRLEDNTPGRPLSVLAFTLFKQFDLFTGFNISMHTFSKFFTRLEDGYLDVPYHNRLHAADVLQNMAVIIQQKSLREVLREQDILAALIAAAIHDFKHPGVNNNFLINSEDPLSTQFNDISVLENMHCAESFKLMREDGFNLLASLSRRMQQEVRQTIITMVLATDMKTHFALHHKLDDFIQKRAEEKEKKETKEDEKKHHEKAESSPKPPVDNTAEHRLLYLQAGLHCSDLGNPAKPLELYLEWTKRIFKEFFAQGDREKELGLTVSPMCDRDNSNMEKSQIGFIGVIVKPMFEMFCHLCPEMKEVSMKHLDYNKTYWEKKIGHRTQPIQHREEKKEEKEEKKEIVDNSNRSDRKQTIFFDDESDLDEKNNTKDEI